MSAETVNMEESKKRLTKFAKTVDIGYYTLLGAIESYLDKGELFYLPNYYISKTRVPDDIWDHYEVVTEQHVSADKRVTSLFTRYHTGEDVYDDCKGCNE